MVNFETVIGLEIHAQLSTATKLFCACDNDSFGKEANTNVCPICMGFPGMLPVTNKLALEKGLITSLALCCDITKESPVGRSICHVFSVAVPSGELTPRGFNEAQSWVFPGKLLTHEPIRAWLEDKTCKKLVHNQPVDDHTLANHGVRLRGGVNTLELARFVAPERAKGRGFDLDSLGCDYCGAGKTESFDSLLGFDDKEPYQSEVLKRRCECGALSCTKKRAGHIEKWPERVEVTQLKKVRRHIPLTDLHPGHPLWARYLAYAAWDAVLALWIYQIFTRTAERTERPYPWTLAL